MEPSILYRVFTTKIDANREVVSNSPLLASCSGLFRILPRSSGLLEQCEFGKVVLSSRSQLTAKPRVFSVVAALALCTVETYIYSGLARICFFS